MKQDFVEVDIPRTKKPVTKRSRLTATVSLHQVNRKQIPLWLVRSLKQ